MLWDEGLLIVLRQEINVDRDQKAAANDCLSTPYVPVLYVLSGFRLDANEIFAFLGCYAWWLVLSDSSRQPVGPILKGQAVQEEFFFCVTSQERRSRVSVCLYRPMWGKGKGIRVHLWTDPEYSRRLGLLEFLESRHMPPADLIPKKYSWYLFLLEAESTPGT